MASKKSKTARVNALPEGYKTLERAPNWDFESNPVLKGIRGPTDEITFGRGKEARAQHVFVVQDEVLGAVAVWESSRLTQLFDETEEGDSVYIEFLGFQAPKIAGDSPTKLFKTAVKQGKKKNPF